MAPMRVLAGLLSVGVALSSTFLAAPKPAQGTAPPQSSAPAPATKTYHDDALHLSYIYPAGFSDASAIVGAAFKASLSESPVGGKDTARCVTLPFSAMSTAGGQLAIVLLVRADSACLKRTFTADQLPEFTQGEVKGLSASGAKPQFGEPVRFESSGHAVEQMQGTFALPTGDSMHAMVTCVLLKPDVACWQLLGNSAESLRTMSAFPVTLDGGTTLSLTAPGARH